jgi:excisionase family DNA binding protein
VDTGDRLLTPGEVAALFRVDPKTVTRWAAAGRIGSIRTPGGHRRFRESEVRALLEGEGALEEEERKEEQPEERQRNVGPAQQEGPGSNPNLRQRGYGDAH